MARSYLALTVRLGLLVCAVTGLPPRTANASTFAEYAAVEASQRLFSQTAGIAAFSMEKEAIDKAYREYLIEQGFVHVGQTIIDGRYPVAGATPGTLVTLGFGFVDPATGLLAGGGPAVASVLYEANFDPSTPDLFVAIGTSTDPATDFSLSFVDQPFEPAIEAIPFDASGDPIVISGAGGQNVAIGLATLLAVPEPRPLWLFLTGLLVLAVVSARFRSGQAFRAPRPACPRPCGRASGGAPRRLGPEDRSPGCGA